MDSARCGRVARWQGWRRVWFALRSLFDDLRCDRCASVSYSSHGRFKGHDGLQDDYVSQIMPLNCARAT